MVEIVVVVAARLPERRSTPVAYHLALGSTLPATLNTRDGLRKMSCRALACWDAKAVEPEQVVLVVAEQRLERRSNPALRRSAPGSSHPEILRIGHGLRNWSRALQIWAATAMAREQGVMVAELVVDW